jgi:hypothetical protein
MSLITSNYNVCFFYCRSEQRRSDRLIPEVVEYLCVKGAVTGAAIKEKHRTKSYKCRQSLFSFEVVLKIAMGKNETAFDGATTNN